MIRSNLVGSAKQLTVHVKPLRGDDKARDWSVTLGKFLKKNSNLIELRIINEDETTPKDLQNILQSIEYNRFLKCLAIVDSNARRVTVLDESDYATSLAGNTSLTVLALKNVKLGGFHSLSKAIQHNKTLRRLIILDETVTEPDLNALLTNLSFNSTLVELRLSERCSTHGSYNQLKAKIAENRANYDKYNHQEIINYTLPDEFDDEPKKVETIPRLVESAENSGEEPDNFIEELLEQLEQCNITNTTQAQEIKLLQDSVDSLQADVDNLNQSKEGLERGTKILKQQLMDHEKKYWALEEQSVTNSKRLQEEIHKLKEENEAYKREIEDLRKGAGHTILSVDIPYDEVVIEKRIGEGGFGEVFKARWHGQNIAVKRIKHSVLVPSRIENLIHESRTVMRMHHKHIILSMGTTQAPDTKEIMLVMEYMKNKSLQNLLFPEEGEPAKLNLHQVIHFALDIAKGLNYLHCLTPKIIHLDLKCENILLYHNKTRAKLSDFGTAKYLNKNSMRKTFQGTIGYIAPEVWEGEAYNEKADVYSFGIVLLVLVTSNDNLPMAHESVKLRTKISEVLEPVTDSRYDVLKQLIFDCCSFNPAERPFMKECIEVLKNLRRIYVRNINKNYY